ncbi:unnamed protein product [Miscanthus lutarioriparius]|uniref:Uncharacterized protein n=1 Tax=Miscanthus lutarioriparius TaxID=422564 RepID=A0A811RS37_9POAL|nr:unnamed protein product [Miscanthus lutarioriparius]
MMSYLAAACIHADPGGDLRHLLPDLRRVRGGGGEPAHGRHGDTFPGICIVWGLAVMVMVYSVGHISGAHLNPAVSVAFPWRQVPAYAAAQVMGATTASLTLRLLFGNAREHFFGTVPAGSDVQSLVIELIISLNLMFVVSGVATATEP